jgi:Zn-dependent M28 family amino/carboxypeptidase
MYKTNRLRSLRTLLNVQLTVIFLGLFANPAQSYAVPSRIPSFRGSAALTDTRRAVEFGERPSGSHEIGLLRNWILSELKPLAGQISLDSFAGETPLGPVPMVNIILKFPGTTGRIVAVSGHYDTKKIPMVRFLGANDGASSTGFLIEFARAVAKTRHRDDLWIVFFDGEEALANWTDTDSLYGSRHLAAKWSSDGTLTRIRALINVDMIGDKNLDIMNDGNSSPALRAMVQRIAGQLGDGKYFDSVPSGIDDDHKPFADAGAHVIDLIDFDYGPGNAYWHTAQDTLDKLSAHSLQVVGDVVMELVKELDGQP